MRCPICGTDAQPERTWQLISPLPDAEGRITITVMGSFRCNSCGHKWRGVVSKIKAGGDSIEVEGGSARKVLRSGRDKERREGQVIVVDLNELDIEE